MPQPLFTPGKDPVPIVQEAGWAPGPVWTGAGNLAPTGIRSPDLPTHSQLIYQLRYPAHCIYSGIHICTRYPIGNHQILASVVEILYIVRKIDVTDVSN